MEFINGDNGENAKFLSNQGNSIFPREAVSDHGGTHNLSTTSFYLFQTRTGTIRPVGIKSAVEARLHLRLANIGHPSEPSKGKLG